VEGGGRLKGANRQADLVNKLVSKGQQKEFGKFLTRIFRGGN